MLLHLTQNTKGITQNNISLVHKSRQHTQDVHSPAAQTGFIPNKTTPQTNFVLHGFTQLHHLLPGKTWMGETLL